MLICAVVALKLITVSAAGLPVATGGIRGSKNLEAVSVAVVSGVAVATGGGYAGGVAVATGGG